MAIAQSQNLLAIGGDFTQVGAATAASYFALYDMEAGTWQVPTDAPNGSVYAIAVMPDGRLMVGGQFTQIGTLTANNITIYDPATDTWDVMGGGLDGAVRAILVTDEGHVYVGGSFQATADGSQTLHFIARWTGTGWEELDNGLNNVVYSLAYDKQSAEIWVGGRFERNFDGTLNLPHVAIWKDGWSQQHRYLPKS